MDNNANFNNMQFDPMKEQPINTQQSTNQSTQQFVQQPQSVSTMNVNQQPVQPQQPKKKINIKLLMIILVAAIVGVSSIMFIPKLLGNKGKNNSQETFEKSNSFWIQGSDYRYALFDIDGNQLTEFKFTYVNSFYNGVALVENENEEEGLISDSGKMIVEFGKYKYIIDHGAVYEMVDEEINEFLYNKSGEFIRELNKDIDKEIESLYEDEYSLILSGTNYKVINHTGKEILTMPISKDNNVYDPVANGIGNYTSVFYNNINYIIDDSKGKVLLTIPDSRHFCIKDVNEEKPNEFILGTCRISWNDELDYTFKLVRDGKIIYTKESDDYAVMVFEGNDVMYNNTYILDEKGNEAIKRFDSYKDFKNYTKTESSSEKVEVYVDGKLKETMDCESSRNGGYSKHGVYLLENCKGYGNANKIYINYDGTRINDKSYKMATPFDENGYASVNEVGRGTNYYLINLKGEKVSNYYTGYISYIDGTDNLYYGTNEDYTKTIFDTNGNEILTGNIFYSENNVITNNIYVAINNDNKYTIHDLTNRKDITVVDLKPDFRSHYFLTYNYRNGKTNYYSYTTGKLFYEK